MLLTLPKVFVLENEISMRIKQAMRMPRKSLESKLAWEHVDELRKKLSVIRERRKEDDGDIDCEMDPLACRVYDV